MGYFLTQVFKDLFPNPPELTERNCPDLVGKIFLITGTSAGVGKELCHILLSKNAHVVAVNRNKIKTEAATKEIFELARKNNPKLTEETLKGRLIHISADLADLSTIKPAADKIFARVPMLDVVVLNAGVMEPPAGSQTEQGWELQFGCNVMAHQLLLDLIEPLVLKAAEAHTTPRVIFLSSISHATSPPNGGLTWEFDRCRVTGQTLYGQSKAGNVYQAAMFAQKHSNVISLAVHPGFLASDLQRSLPTAVRWFNKAVLHPPIFGAYTELWASVSPNVTLANSGGYIGPWGEFRPLRADIDKGRFDGTAKKMLDWVEIEIARYK